MMLSRCVSTAMEACGAGRLKIIPEWSMLNESVGKLKIALTGVRPDASGRDPGRAEEEQSGTGEQKRKQRQRALMCLVSNFSVPDPGVSDHKAISIEWRSHAPSGTLRRSLDQLEETLNMELKKPPDDAELKRVQQYEVDVTLDPDTAHPKLILSEDGKQVHDGGVRKKFPDNPKRFTSTELSVRGAE
ncbi:unnamed protein product [Gadus morhua 'NCC']